MKEKAFENKIKEWLKNHNCYNVKFFANGYTKRGVPDILTCVNGWFIGIETKSDEGEPTKLQLYNIKKIRESGGFGWVVYPSGWNDLEQMLLNILNGCVAIDASDYILK